MFRQLVALAAYILLPIAKTATRDQPQITERHDDEITHLPGLRGGFKSRHYGGYITVDESHKRNLYYYFVTSESKPAEDPLVLWLNGGPGCSSFDGEFVMLVTYVLIPVGCMLPRGMVCKSHHLICRLYLRAWTISSQICKGQRAQSEWKRDSPKQPILLEQGSQHYLSGLSSRYNHQH